MTAEKAPDDTATAIFDDVWFSLNGGQAFTNLGQATGGDKQWFTVDNNMTMSIVSIFLFWPLAIPAIINASKVNPLLVQGDIAGAEAAAAE